LSRILNEQIRPQLGRGWGSAKHPDCAGIEVADLARVDWSRVDLDEWLAILTRTGHFPTADTLDLEDLTGEGGALNVDGGRTDAAERSTVRSEGLDGDAARRDAEMELWDATVPGLP
jgi:conjugal transfer mating pair stabilization protein TraN